MAKDEIGRAARMMARRRDKKLGRKGLSEMAFSGARTKTVLYGPQWAKKVQQGLRLKPLTNLPPTDGGS